jgi:hypothetical protein
MKILYVVSRPLEINTSASIRNRATIEGLVELGHNVNIITTEPDEKHINYDSSIKNPNIETTYLKLGGMQTAARVGRRFRFLKPLKKLAYNYLAKSDIYDNLKGIANYVDKLGITDEDYDLIISSSDPKSSHLFVNKMFEKKIISKTPWIQIWGDPFLSDITRKNKSLNKKIKKEEDSLLNYATKVVYVSYLTLEEQKNIYPSHAEKMEYTPVPYIKEEIYPKVDLEKKSLTFLYCGDYHSNVRNIKPLYDAIKETKHRLIICGNSDVKLENTEHISIYPRVSYEKIKQFEKESDVLVHLSNLKGTQIPGKIYHYSGTNKPILFILDGDKEKIINMFAEYNRYIFTENSISNLNKVLLNISDDKYKETLFSVKKFSPSNIAEEI